MAFHRVVKWVAAIIFCFLTSLVLAIPALYIFGIITPEEMTDEDFWALVGMEGMAIAMLIGFVLNYRIDPSGQWGGKRHHGSDG